jgi:general secretion pathway protein G
MLNGLKSFSLIEIIFAILIMAVISAVALPKLFSFSQESSFHKLRSDIATIQNGLQNHKNNSIMKNLSRTLESLEEDEKHLFSFILKHPIVSNGNYPFWSKQSDKSYLFHFNETTELEFIYNKSNLTFLCDTKNTLCQKVLE